jgi:Fe-Mn family superoxide dismutase
MSASAIGNFGSGRTWLVKNTDGSLEIMNTSNA